MCSTGGKDNSLSKSGHSLIMKTVEHDEENTDSRWEPQDPLLRETIWFDQSILEGADIILLRLYATIKWSKIQV